MISKFTLQNVYAYRPDKDMKSRPKSLSSPLDQMSSVNYQTFRCVINPQISKIFVGKSKIYLNDTKLNILLYTGNWQISNETRLGR